MSRDVTKMSDEYLAAEFARLSDKMTAMNDKLDWDASMDSPQWVAYRIVGEQRWTVQNEQWYREQVRSLDSDKMAALLLIANQPRITDEIALALRNADMIDTITNRDGTAVHMITALGRRALGI